MMGWKLPERRFRGTDEERFWPKVNKTDSCWLWKRAVNAAGYGTFFATSYTSRLAHRTAYEMLVGPIPGGHVLDHLCYTPSCVRPDHMQVVTQARNMENRKGANKNSKTGILGVSPAGRKGNRYRATFRAAYLGAFDTAAEAEAAVVAARNAQYTNNLLDRIAS